MPTRSPASANARLSGRPTWPPPPRTTRSRSSGLAEVAIGDEDTVTRSGSSEPRRSLRRAVPGKELLEYIDHVIHPSVVDPGKNADEEGLIHDDVGVVEIADHAPFDGLESWVTQKVAAEQAPRLDPVRLEVGSQLV